MDPTPLESEIGVLLSGGLDSAILLGHLLEQGHRVRPFYVQSCLVWEGEELAAARRFLQALRSPRLADLVVLHLSAKDLYADHWSVTGRDVPEAGTADEAVFLPGRNLLLTVQAALWCRLHAIDRLALGVLASNPFGDAAPEFFAALETTLGLAVGGRLKILRPLAHLSKRQVMELGRNLPLGLTFSCIAPAGGLHCGRCNKCGERRAAFLAAGLADPTRYANPVADRN